MRCIIAAITIVSIRAIPNNMFGLSTGITYYSIHPVNLLRMNSLPAVVVLDNCYYYCNYYFSNFDFHFLVAGPVWIVPELLYRVFQFGCWIQEERTYSHRHLRPVDPDESVHMLLLYLLLQFTFDRYVVSL